MDYDAIINNANKFGCGKKRVTHSTATTVVDAASGEILRSVEDEYGWVDKEPDYIKVYTSCLLAFRQLDTKLAPYIVSFGKWMTYANFDNAAYRCTVRTTKIERHDVAIECGVTEDRVKQVIRQLVASEIFIPIEIDGKIQRGIYYVNPWVVSKGEWRDIRQLRANFEFVEGATSVLSVSKDGTIRTIVSKSPSISKKSDQIPGQISLPGTADNTPSD